MDSAVDGTGVRVRQSSDREREAAAGHDMGRWWRCVRAGVAKIGGGGGGVPFGRMGIYLTRKRGWVRRWRGNREGGSESFGNEEVAVRDIERIAGANDHHPPTGHRLCLVKRARMEWVQCTYDAIKK